MPRVQIQPYILGRGMSGQAMVRSLALIRTLTSDFEVLPEVQVARDQDLGPLARAAEHPLLLIANPHGLHARALVEGAAAGFRHMVVDKPACVRLEEIPQLEALPAHVSVCHGYRQAWGPQLLRELIVSGECGEVFAIEGRYWQSSAAARALAGAAAGRSSWKNDPALNGPFDTLADLGTHWVDLAFFLMGQSASRITGWLGRANAESAGRDTHVQLSLEFGPGKRGLASISKTAHGATNALEVHVLGTRKTVSWRLMAPDELVIGEGGRETLVPREVAGPGTGSRPFHGLGWIEGYVDILHQSMRRMAGLSHRPVPTLAESLEVMRAVLSADLRE